MNPLFIALPLFVVLAWVLAVIVVRHDRKVRLNQQQVERSERHYWASRAGNRWRSGNG